MFRKVSILARRASSIAFSLARSSAALLVLLDLLLPPFSVPALAQQTTPPPATAPKPDNEALMNSLLRARADAAAKVKIPAAHEFFKSNDPQVVPHGGRISLRNLDLSRPPSEKELRQAGQLGSALTPSDNADPNKITDPAKKQAQQADNLLFGQAMQKWNEHAYGEAVKIFREHRRKFPTSPWAGEAELHLGCQAQFSGSWAEAKFSFEWILNNHKAGDDIYQKAKLRRAVLHLDQGELVASRKAFVEMLATETSWERRTYATHWLQQLSIFKAHEVALRDCGMDSVAAVLRSRGQDAIAVRVKATEAPDPRGFSLGGLAEFAAKAGLDSAAAVRLGFEDLDNTPYPFIAHYSDRHFVAVLRQDDNKRIWIYDPRLKRETALTREQFGQQWSGLGIIFGGLPEGGRLASVEEMAENYGGCCGLPRNENQLGPPCRDPRAMKKCCGMPVWEVNPVNMNLVVEDAPMWFDEAVGPDVFLRIAYNTQDALNQLRPFGNKWTFEYATYALESPAQGGSGTVLIVMPGGRRDNYQPNGTGGYTSPVGIYNVLSKTSAYTFNLQLPDGTIYHYGVPAGMSGTTSLLLSITDRHGFSMTMGYDTTSGNITSITDNQNRSWTFSYNTQGFVSQIADPFGRQATFSYDGSGNLVGQTDMGGLSYGYTYDANSYLTSVIKPTGTTTFYIEPADGIVNDGLGYPNYTYPPSGGVMWENYRITITDPLGNKEEYYYDGYSADPHGWYRDKTQMYSTLPIASAPKTRYDYTVVANQGVVSKVTYADGTYKQLSNYNANRQAQTFLDERGHTQSFTYNSQGMILTRTDERNNITTYAYAANGFDLQSVTDALNHVVLQVGYDGNRNVTSLTDALSRATTTTYNGADQPATITDAGSYTRMLTYDNSTHLLTTITQGGNTLRSLTYDAFDRVATSADADGYTLGYTYDGLNRRLRVTFPDTTYTENQWGCCTIERQIDRAGGGTTFVYDSLNRPEIIRDAAGSFTFYEYDTAGDTISLIDGNQNRTQWFHDARHRVAKKVYADNSSESYGYDGVGNRTGVTDALGVTMTYVYDNANNLTSRSATGLATVSFLYDALNRPSQMTDGLGSTTIGYDNASELTGIAGPWASITLGYDALGRLNTRTIDGSASGVVFDAYGRLSSAANPLGAFTYGYATAASTELTSIALTGGLTTTLGYYPNASDKRLQEILNTNSAGQTISKFDYQYNALGGIATWIQQADSNPAQTYGFDYDPVGQLLDATLKLSNGAVQRAFGYRYDGGGNRVGATTDTLPSQDTVNSLNQLTSRQSGTGVIPIRGQTDKPVSSVTVNGSTAKVRGQTFEGSATVTGGTNTVTVVATDWSNNVKTQQYQVAITGSGSKTLSYDLKGNLLSDGSKTYEWDVLNRLTAINYTGSSPALRTEFAYDGFGNRAKIIEKSGGTVASEKHFVWIPGDAQPSEERDASNNVTRRFYVQGEQIAGNNYYFTRDHLGSIREMTDSSGVLRARYAYDPFGRYCDSAGQPQVQRVNLITTNPLDADFGFTGDYWHVPSALCVTKFRFYDAGFGRWLSRDPIEENGGINLYSYVGNNVINFSDPLGLLPADNSLSANPGEAADLLSGDLIMENPAMTDAERQLARELLGNGLKDSERIAVDQLKTKCPKNLLQKLAKVANNGITRAARAFKNAGSEEARQAARNAMQTQINRSNAIRTALEGAQ